MFTIGNAEAHPGGLFIAGMTMIDIKITDGKIVFQSGDLQYVDGAERVRQQIEFRLSLFRGEWFLDADFGTPYFQSILGKHLTINGAINALRAEILAIDGVTGLKDFTWDLDRKNRLLTVEFEAQTDYGLIQYP
ncbi:Phage protein [Sodalis praecaptivus]|uniref:Phage protein n=1 Tax=Sodalis praecaptivus TaxID=1239307 RepID=W0I0B3_9GAMM|nr:hypothetical protein [Sodalis praecaptivus]AHF77888.1 Phage protein [Sodalis praecaptivus]